MYRKTELTSDSALSTIVARHVQKDRGNLSTYFRYIATQLVETINQTWMKN